MSFAAPPLAQPRQAITRAVRVAASLRLAVLGRWLPIAGWLALALLILIPGISGSRYLVYLGALIALQAALATSLNLVMGYAGQFAMSHAAFYGFGAYASALLVTSAGLGFWISIPVTMLLAAMLAAAIGYPALRYTGGVHLALITFAFGMSGPVANFAALAQGGAPMTWTSRCHSASVWQTITHQSL